MASSHALIEHDEIQHWAEDRKAKPACVKRTGGKGDPGMIRLDFPGFSGAQSLSPISWDAWFKAFDDNNLALLVQDTTARGQRSNFNKLVSRESITEGLPPRRRRKQAARRSRSSSSGRRTGGTTRSTSTSGRSPTGRTATRKAKSASTTRKSAGGAAARTRSTARASAADRSSRTRTGQKASRTRSGQKAKSRR
jgi:hypothetical protein